MNRVEVDLLVQRLHRGNLFLIDRQAVVRLAEREIDGQLAEERRVLGPRLAVAQRHHVVVERRQRLGLEAIPEALGIGRNPLVHRRLAGDGRLDPPGRDAHALVVRKAIEERPLDDGRFERPAEQRRAARRGRDHLVRRRADRRHLEMNLLQVDLQLRRQDLVDRVDLEQPPRRRVHPLLLPACGRADLGELDRDPIDRLVLERRPHHVVEPAVALLVGGQHRHRRLPLVGARLDQLGPRVLFDPAAHLGRFAQPCFDRHRRLLLQAGNHLRAQLRPELVNLGRDLEVVVDQRPAFLHVEILDVDGHRRGLDRRGRLFLHRVGEAVGGLLDPHLHARGREVLTLQLLANLVQLVEAHRRLPGRGAAGEEPAHVLLDIVQRGAVLAALPDVRERFGELVGGAAQPGGVAAGDDERAFLAERLLHQLDQPFARLQRGGLPLVVLDQLLDDRMRGADQHEDRFGRRRGQRFRSARDRQRDAGGLEPEPRREVDNPFRAVAFGAQQHVDAVRDQVVVGVGERAFVRVEGREVEVLLGGAAGPARRRLHRRGRFGRRLRQLDRGRSRTGRAQPDLQRAHGWVGQRPLHVAGAGRLELVQRDHRLDDVAAVGHLQRHGDAFHAVRAAGARVDR